MFPTLSLVENVGFDGTGLHKSRSNVYNLDSNKRIIKFKHTSKIYNNKENLLKVSYLFLKKELNF